MHRKTPGIALIRTLGLSVSLLGLLLALALPATPSAQAAGDASEAVCPNEASTGFSAALPECRAFEQVSPPYKNGFNVGFERQFAGGERVEASSFAVLPGTTGGNCINNQYEIVRGTDGWVTLPFKVRQAGLTLAGSTCPVTVFGEGGDAVSSLRPISGSVFDRDLYLATNEGESFTPIGPTLPSTAVPTMPTGESEFGEVGSYSFTAASPDLSHVLFTTQPLEPGEATFEDGIASPLWPGDTTELSGLELASLYEYVGTNNTAPSLIGVDNAGSLISDCGTFPGGGSGRSGQGPPGNHDNVISADGETVFFTAVGAEGVGANNDGRCVLNAHRPLVDEVFARLHGDRPQSPVDSEGKCEVPGDACTVALSEPQALAPAKNADCTAACAEDTSKANEDTDWRNANFEGAAAAGTKMFFTSTQRLTDDAVQDPETGDSAVEPGIGQGCARTTPGDGGCNLYEYDFEVNPGTGVPGGLVLLSGGDAAGAEVQGVAGISEDGSHVYFVAKGVLTAAVNGLGAKAVAGGENLYVRDTVSNETRFVATLSELDAGEWPSDGGGFGQGFERVDVSGDGRFLVFTSVAHITPDDTSGVEQVFRYDDETGALVRVSAGSEGFNNDGNTTAGEVGIARGGSKQTYDIDRDRHPAVSEDGMVVFGSSIALTSGASNNRCVAGVNGLCESLVQNGYEYADGHVYLLTSGVRDLPSVSLSGRDIFFETVNALVPQDTDSSDDIYDARVDGGFPVASGGAGCAGEGCQLAPAAAPVFAAPVSTTFTGSGAAPPALTPAKSKPRALSRAQKLANAVRTCRQKRKKARTSCESAARRKYGPKAKKSSSDRRPGR